MTSSSQHSAGSPPPDPRLGAHDPGPEPTSLGELFGRLSEQTSRLVHAEIELAKAELKAKLTKMGIGAGLLVVAGVLALYALDKLFDAAALGLAEALSPWLAFLLVGVALLLIVGGLAFAGIKALQAGTPPSPERAIKNVKNDIDAVKKGVQR